MRVTKKTKTHRWDDNKNFKTRRVRKASQEELHIVPTKSVHVYVWGEVPGANLGFECVPNTNALEIERKSNNHKPIPNIVHLPDWGSPFTISDGFSDCANVQNDPLIFGLEYMHELTLIVQATGIIDLDMIDNQKIYRSAHTAGERQ